MVISPRRLGIKPNLVYLRRTMTLLHEAVEAKNFDTRMIERGLTRGIVSQDQVEKTAKALTDDSANALAVSLDDLAAWDGMSAKALPNRSLT